MLTWFGSPGQNMFHAGKCSRATQKSFIGCKWPQSGTMSATDLQQHVSARPSEHVINWRSWLLSLAAMARLQNFSFSACLHSDKEYFIEGVIWPSSPRRMEAVSLKSRSAHNECRAAHRRCCRRDCSRSPFSV